MAIFVNQLISKKVIQATAKLVVLKGRKQAPFLEPYDDGNEYLCKNFHWLEFSCHFESI